MALLVGLMLGEDAAQISLASLGGAVGLFAFASGQFLAAHGHAGAVGADIHDWGAAKARLRLPLLPRLGVGSNPLRHALDLTGRNLNAARLGQMLLGLLIARLVGSLQAEQPGQSRRITHFQTKSRIGRITALLFALVVIVVALQIKAAKETLDLQALTAFALFTRFGRVSRVDSVGRPLQQASYQRAGGFENGRAHQELQFLHQFAFRPLAFKTRHQLLDFFFLGEKNVRGAVFFLKPASRSARLCSATNRTYCWINCSN
jgi:hypothetical protein